MYTQVDLNSKVKASKDDERFWLSQIAEHAKFLEVLLDPNVADDFIEEAHEIYEGFMNSSGEYASTMTLVLVMYALLNAIKEKLQELPNISLFISEDYEDVVDHMLEEQTYFIRLIQGRLTVEDEILFWVKEAAEHSRLFATLVSDSGVASQLEQETEDLETIRDEFLSDPNVLERIIVIFDRSLATDTYLVELINRGAIRDIDEAMVTHEIRESNRGKARLEYLISVLILPME